MGPEKFHIYRLILYNTIPQDGALQRKRKVINNQTTYETIKPKYIPKTYTRGQNDMCTRKIRVSRL